MDLATCAGVYSVVSLETAHSTTTSSTTIAAVAASTITAISTLLVTVNDDATTTNTIHSMTTSSVFGHGNASLTGAANTTYVPFTGEGGKVRCMGLKGGVGFGVGWGLIAFWCSHHWF